MTKKGYTHIALVVDRSGSMQSIAADMNGGMATFLSEQAALPGEVTVDVTIFDTEVDTPYTLVDALDVEFPILVPRGGTALNDALCTTIVKLGESLAKMDEANRPEHVIVLVVTDGEENSSREYTTEQAKAMVGKQIEEWQWEFIFMAANIDAFAAARDYGIGRGQTMSYDATAKGAGGTWAAASASATRTRSGLVSDFTEEERQEAGG